MPMEELGSAVCFWNASGGLSIASRYAYVFIYHVQASPVVKNPPAKQESQVRSLGQEDPLALSVATEMTEFQN